MAGDDGCPAERQHLIERRVGQLRDIDQHTEIVEPLDRRLAERREAAMFARPVPSRYAIRQRTNAGNFRDDRRDCEMSGSAEVVQSDRATIVMLTSNRSALRPR